MGKASVSVSKDSLKIQHAYDTFISERPWSFNFSIDTTDHFGVVRNGVVSGSTQNISGNFDIDGVKSIRVLVNGVLAFDRELGPDQIVHCSGYVCGGIGTIGGWKIDSTACAHTFDLNSCSVVLRGYGPGGERTGCW